MKKRCIIIGSGLGGLSVGVVLARGGYEVTILEQGHQVGGCLQCFTRGGAKFETGMHIVGSLDEGQVFSNYLNFLGVKDRLAFSRLDTAGYDIVSLGGTRFPFANGHEAMIERLGEYFPKEKDHLAAYWRMVDTIARHTPYYDLGFSESRNHGITELRNYGITDKPMSKGREPSIIDSYPFTHSLDEVLEATFDDPLLREVLVGNGALYAARRGRTPFSSHAFIADLYNSSAFRIVGSSDNLARALVEEFEKHGGEVRVDARVVHAECKGDGMSAVRLADGEVVEGDLFIADIHPTQMTCLFDDSVLRPAYVARIHSIPNTPSVFSLFLKFRPDEVPYMNSSFYGFDNCSPWEMEDYAAGTWPRGYLYMHQCHEEHPLYAQTGVVLAYMSPDELSAWEHTGVGRRGADYEAFKRQRSEMLLTKVEKDFPGLGQKIESVYAATPLTYRDYTLTPDGSIYGMAKDITLGTAGHVSYRTKIPNLFLVGQNITAHGIMGVLVGTVNTCSAILGEETVRREMEERNGVGSGQWSVINEGGSQLNTKHLIQNTNKVLVMGGGVGGLISGALLAKEGYRVTVLEKNNRAGGGLCSFTRHGKEYPTGMHIFGGFQPGGQLDCLCRYLGIRDQLHLVDCIDEVVDISHQLHYRLPKGRDAFSRRLIELFPNQEKNILDYIEALYRLADEEDLFFLRPDSRSPWEHSDEFVEPANKFISNYISDPALQTLLAHLTPLCGGIADETPAYMHALVSLLHIEGASQFVGASQQLADALTGVIISHGGEVRCGEEIAAIEVENRSIRGVVTAHGHRYCADRYVGDLPTSELIRLMPPGAFPPSFRKRLTEAPLSYSAFKVHLALAPGKVAFQPVATFCTRSESNPWTPFVDGEEACPQMLMYTAHPDPEARFVEAVTLISPMPFDWVRKWEDSSVGHRGQDYLDWKEDKSRQLVDFLRQVWPEAAEHIVSATASSPLTIRDYLGNRDGAMYGLHKDCNNMMQTELSVRTKVQNLYLTGQDVNLHGLCGVALTSISTVETLTADTSLRKRIKTSNQ